MLENTKGYFSPNKIYQFHAEIDSRSDTFEEGHHSLILCQ